MKAAVWYGPGNMQVEERPLPEVSSGSILVEVKACAICGSDLRIFNDGNPRITQPQIIGHEIAGDVVEVGSGVTRFKIGDRISVGADVPCGQCVHCNNGRPNCCDTNLAIGYQMEGGNAQYILLDSRVVENGPVQTFSPNLSYDAAALAEPLACCINGYERALFEKGGVVVVMGAGPIGQMLVQLGAKYYDAEKIIVIEPSEFRLEKSVTSGSTDTIDPTSTDPVAAVMELTGGRGADAIFTANGVVQSHEQAIAMVAKRGVVNLFGGLPKSAPPIQLHSNHLHYREAYLTGSHGSTPQQHKAALNLIECGTIQSEALVTHSFGLDQILDAFSTARSGKAIKVIVHPNG
jgi:L-iditol 2-dehydrogenase